MGLGLGIGLGPWASFGLRLNRSCISAAAQHATIQLDVSTRGGALQSPRDPRARCVAGQSVEGGATDSPLTLFAPPHVIAEAPQQATPSAAGGGASGGGGGGFLRRWLSKLGR